MIVVEAYSILLRTAPVCSNFNGGYESFLNNLPNQTHRSDGELERVGFMVWSDLIKYGQFLESEGLKLNEDFAFFHMLEGLMTECEWIRWNRWACFEGYDDEFTLAWLSPEFGGKEEDIVYFPKFWTPEKGLKSSDLINPDEVNTRYKLISNENGFCTYWDSVEQKEIYIGRTDNMENNN